MQGIGLTRSVRRIAEGEAEITSINHGFAVQREELLAGFGETNVSRFDDWICGFELEGRPKLSVQYHPKVSPGPLDSFYLFEKCAGLMR